jgi:ribosomal protein S18 acetylase RimI-like enzyme
MDLTIAPLTDADLDGAALAIASGEVFQWYGLDPARARNVLLTAREEVVVARRNDGVAGVAVFRNDGVMPIPAYLRILAVRDGSRGQGVGKALLQYVESQAFARGPNLFLCCVDSNTRARRFYEREGYELVGPLNDLIAPGINELLYRKSRGPIRGYVPGS